MNDLNKFVDEYFNVHQRGEVLGQGGQGIVFRTKDPNIAVKLVTDQQGQPVTNQADLERYQRRLQSVRRLPLPDNLPLAAPVALLKNNLGYAMHLLSDMIPFSSFWLDGKTAEKLEAKHIPAWLSQIPAAAAKSIVHYNRTGGLRRRLAALYKCAAILARLHGNGLVYGDISPNNIFLSGDLEELEVWLIDADNLRFEVASGGSSVYTQKYAAPEILQGLASSGARTDCHAFAVLAFYTLTMVHPFMGELVENGGWDDWADDNNTGLNIEDQAYAGLLPWVDDPEDRSNQSSQGLPRELVLTEELKKLFQETFGPGRTEFWQRPAIYHWPRALAQAADRTVLCPKCNMSWYVDIDEPQCPYCGSAKPAVLLFEAYRWLGQDVPPGPPCWTLVREVPKDEQPLCLPERLFAPLTITGGDRTTLKLRLDNRKILLSKSENCKLDMAVAVSGEQGGKFKNFVSQLQLPHSALRTGFWLYLSGDQPRLIKCSTFTGGSQ